ncbi:MAG: Flp pilus assembly complex ATPase component [PVC group bacterium]|nr:Flp pilus assembly complex ATPase component [PVC group bacterium]
MSEKTTKLIDVLLSDKLITQAQLDEAWAEHKKSGTSIHKILVNRGYLSSEQLALILSQELDIPYVTLAGQKLDPQVIKMLPEDVARKYKAIPVMLEEDSLYVAFVWPLNLPVRDEIKLIIGCNISPMVATEKDIDQAINQYYSVEDSSKQVLTDLRMQQHKEQQEDGDIISVEDEIGKLEDIPVVRLLNTIINGAINMKASDIHLEPQDPEMKVRYRVDGILRDVMSIPRHIEPAMLSRIKVMANLDIAEKRRSQDGHINIKKEGQEYDLRVSTLLTVNGEKVVMRILDRSSALISLLQMGLNPEEEQLVSTMINKPYGMILVTGPTGSGKTTTLYAILNQLNDSIRNIITIENPVEYNIAGINQIQVDPAIDMTFSAGLKTILRQDPDIIMVGEIRDKETAEIAIQAALTGHLVLSTLHTNDAPRAVTRLIDMGVEPFLISSTVIGTIAQRLCRRICPECKSEIKPCKEELQKIGVAKTDSEVKFFQGKGCDYCYQTGYRGRTGIFEIMPVSDGISKLIVKGRPASEIKAQAIQAGMKTLKENGRRKILEGISTLEEVERVVYVEDD